MQDTFDQPKVVNISELLGQFQAYASARVSFLSQLQQDKSCRDPLAEFSEVLVAILLGAKWATSRVQKGYDLIRPNGRRVQVKYLANPSTGWINWHTVYFTDNNEDYALAVFVAFQLQSVLVFPCESIGQVCKCLGKRHPHQDTALQFTERNHKDILADPLRYKALGVEIFQFGETAAG